MIIVCMTVCMTSKTEYLLALPLYIIIIVPYINFNITFIQEFSVWLYSNLQD